MTEPDDKGPVESPETPDAAAAPTRQYSTPDDERTGPSPFVLLAVLAALFALGAGVVVTSMNKDAPKAPDAAVAAPDAPTGPAVHLKLFVEHDEAAVELPAGVVLEPGEIVMFELSADAPAEVRVWVEIDGLLSSDLGTFETTPEAGMLADGADLVAFGLGQTGTVVFRASSASSGCSGDSCDSVVVSVR